MSCLPNCMVRVVGGRMQADYVGCWQIACRLLPVALVDSSHWRPAIRLAILQHPCGPAHHEVNAQRNILPFYFVAFDSLRERQRNHETI